MYSRMVSDTVITTVPKAIVHCLVRAWVHGFLGCRIVLGWPVSQANYRVMKGVWVAYIHGGST